MHNEKFQTSNESLKHKNRTSHSSMLFSNYSSYHKRTRIGSPKQQRSKSLNSTHYYSNSNNLNGGNGRQLVNSTMIGKVNLHDRRRRKTFCCVNCGIEGHVYKQCTEPITSFGIIAIKRKTGCCNELNPLDKVQKFKCKEHQISSPDDIPLPLFLKNNTQDESNDEILYLMVQRKDTIGFIDFIRGKYPDDAKEQTSILKTYLEEMTCDERSKLSQGTFEDLWDMLWINKLSMLYINEYMEAKRKFEKLNVTKLLKETKCKWTEQEYGFPKGRKNMYESNLECAKREFKEETGYTSDQIKIIGDKHWEEIFIGTNGIQYRHVYYIAEILPHVSYPKIPLEDIKLSGEISNMGWFTFDQCNIIIRPYDVAKKELLCKVHEKYKTRFTKS